ncbi:EAL domain-containing protein [Desulfuromonas acetoxidans]|uniref:Diguanylate cyclase/phosphodiesterase with PAS/PAC sensor(S) n=1 Tax=Desulfuromonas acetoxidans (strain DSM 684 / 11070) TaxID=281689 RepID=Q1JY96_DESA6|nr:EAL domain-containing protein [Desulfuromonas acetoxidans]EAT15310.1 diguanylate cyclase/phosphodiesterase with PAS/PAC sensor(s) [Desulfuromonas acetoxidans DSM 684]MBF0645581.1 EAL domain-containing protein [Desulfuromonas acetoxidans]NVD23383.1 EAL domain-containing protein [Desulfuromonas acetoxidans]NVE15376.1 EAL domain-containing protein [Desulfuromonas acetoxidans]
MNPFFILRPRPLKMTTYLMAIAFLFAVLFIVLLSGYSYLDNRKTVVVEIRKNAHHNQRMVEAVLEQRLKTLDTALKNASQIVAKHYSASTPVASHQAITNSLMAFYERDPGGALDLLCLKLNDGAMIDVTSPFFASPQLQHTLTTNPSALAYCPGTGTVLLQQQEKITALSSGRIIGTIYAATVVNDNLELLQELEQRITAEAITLQWNNQPILGHGRNAINQSQIEGEFIPEGFPRQAGEFFYIDNRLTINNQTSDLLATQKLSGDLLTQLNESLRQGILSVFFATLISAGGVIIIFRYLTQRSLNTVLQMTEAAFRNTEPARYKPTLVSEFNILGHSIVDLDHQRKESEKQLLLSSSVFDNAVEGIVITNLDGIIEQVNPACEAMSGYRLKELIGENPRIFRSDHHNSAFYQQMWQSLIEEGRWEGEVWNRRKNGEVYPLNVSISRCTNSAGIPSHYVAIFHDISEIKRSEEKLQHQAYHDALTNLPNRKLFHDRLSVAVAHARQHKTKLAVIYLDIDNFKYINDSLGHHYGDKLLQQISERLLSCTRQEDTTARLGGDEFIILMPEIEDPHDITVLCRRILKQLELPHALSGRDYTVNVSMGVTVFPDDADTPEDLIKNADIAMYRAKEAGKNGYQLFTAAMQQTIMQRIELEARLSDALCRNEFVLFYQPQVDLESEHVIGAEALIRWQKPDGQLVYPDEFIPIAEECGLITQIDHWVLKAACRQANKWREQSGRNFKMSVNLSSEQFAKDQELVQRVKNVLNKTGLPAECLTLEVTENAVMSDTESAIAIMTQLTALGVSIAIDDFGTGYSSLSYVKNFPARYLKIDRSFVKDIPGDSDDMAIAASIISLGRNLNMEVIAEGVEEQTQIDFLKQHRCQQVQGYFYGKPCAAEFFSQQFF